MNLADIKKRSLYSDNHILAVNKPAGLLTQPSRDNSESLENLAKALIKKEKNKPGNVFLHPIHRLDKDASGIVLFAKTSKALSRLNESMRNREIRKTYFAVTGPSPSQKKGVLEHYIKHKSHYAEIVNKEARGSKKAVLSYNKISEYKKTSLLEISLETGRYHQIRVQLAGMGWPIVGDKRYGSNYRAPKNTILLHHCKMDFDHPVGKERMVIVSDFPAEWAEIIA